MKTLEEVKAGMAGISLCAGECREYLQCPDCGNVLVREYIPYGLGYGRSYNECTCYLTGGVSRSKFKTLEKVDGPLPKEDSK